MHFEQFVRILTQYTLSVMQLCVERERETVCVCTVKYPLGCQDHLQPPQQPKGYTAGQATQAQSDAVPDYITFIVIEGRTPQAAFTIGDMLRSGTRSSTARPLGKRPYCGWDAHKRC